MEWFQAVDRLSTSIIRIRTPSGSGSGFILPWTGKADLIAIATAAHVVNQAFYWEQPIRLDQIATSETLLLRQEDRAIYLDEARDSAVIIFKKANLTLPEKQFSFIPQGKLLKVGNEVAWLGFPAIASSVCFFSGRVSAIDEPNKAYLVDAVAVNGVSGGCVFSLYDSTVVTCIGIVSAYIANRTTGETLPGLSVVRDASYMIEQASKYSTLDEAIAAQQEPVLPAPVPAIEPPTIPTRAQATPL